MSSGVAETIDENERRAREELRSLVEAGKAQEILETWAFCKQSCDYVYGIVQQVATDPYLEGTGQQSFARNLLDDWSK